MLDDNSMDTWCTRFEWITNDFEGTVFIGDHGAHLVTWNCCRSRYAASFSERYEVADHRQVRNWCSIFDKTQLASHVEGGGEVPVPNKRGDGLIDDLNLFCGWACVKRNPTEVGVSVSAVLLQANFTPSGSIFWEDRIAITVPSAASKSADIACRKSSEAGHGDERGVEFIARSLFGCFDEDNAEVFRGWNA